MRAFLPLFAMLAPLVCASCGPTSTSNRPRATPTPTPAAKVSTDIKKLSRLVNLPRRPLSVSWTYGRRGVGGGFGPTDYALFAILRFKPSDIASFGPSPIQPLDPDSELLPVQAWFPEDLKQHAVQFEGKPVLRTRRLNVQPFWKTPLLNGLLLRIPDTNYCILDLYTT